MRNQTKLEIYHRVLFWRQVRLFAWIAALTYLTLCLLTR